MEEMRNKSVSPALPTKEDFNPWGPDSLDAECAWRNFGGLALPEADAKFRERPYIYQEDFMFMGGKAFAYYFPIIEEYLLAVPERPDDTGDEREAWILAHCIAQQLSATTAPAVLHLMPRFISLAQFVQRNVNRFAEDQERREAILDAWQELEKKLRAHGTCH